MTKLGWLKTALVVGGLLFLFWGGIMLFFPETGHDRMFSQGPYNPSATMMFGAALLSVVIGVIIALRDPIAPERKELVHFLFFPFALAALVALILVIAEDMNSNFSTWGSLVLSGLVALTLLVFRP